MSEVQVDLVAVDRRVWSGNATFVFARTVSGEIGILPNHIPLVAQLVDDAMVRIDSVDEGELKFAVDGGFLSVNGESVTILAESVESAEDIDVDAAQRDSESSDEQTAARGRARLRAVGRSV
ncbi:F0F1 ATP synthase subunit epsilon [Antrihabitans sp. YC2-6]|uniref:F0F1 ATP synthase subunit epsilon n=1 Tax=Antrihabitans sp. YC2-6 TaxID=2799498 RepID=UPI0018F3F386|nr:F0F1 ATP synthase subunit epsilon [Antrihabitans sp. YC2-6]MBJ8348213.1 F0F1 ATP synthase subunit epsilon [Antrihabitans sp. YC2-6]